MEQKKLRVIVKRHEKWIAQEEGGVKANLLDPDP